MIATSPRLLSIFLRRAAVALNSKNANSHASLGKALGDLNHLHKALASYDRAIAICPEHIDALIGRGNVLQKFRRVDAAVTCYDRVLALHPNNVRALYDRGVALRILGRSDEALASFNRALAQKPDHVNALINSGELLRARGEIREAVARYRRAVAIQPKNALIHTSLIFTLNFDSDVSEADKQSERAQWNIKHASQFRRQVKPHDNDPVPNRRLRIGYVTREFAAVFAFGGVILNHDPKQFEIVCYSDLKHEGKISAHFHKHADQWRLTSGLSDDQMAELIRRDGIDILVDVNGHMGRHRLLVFARKPAPIQVTAWGEPTGTGLDVMDYLLADPVLVPHSERPLLRETVVDLPNFLGYWTPEPLPQPGPLPALAHGHITFGSFSRLPKITHPVISSWASILNKLPTARLILKDKELSDADNRTYLEQAFFAQGVSAERLTILGNTDRASHFAAYQMIDIALDPFPHGGGLTTLDAMWMGVPVLTWPSQTISSRLAAASLAKLGLMDFIADSAANYVDLAIAKAGNLEALSQLRSNLRDRVASTEFGDSSRYSRAVEAAYRQMWHRWCAEQTSHTG